MRRKEVTGYSLQWSPQHRRGVIILKLEDGQETKLRYLTADEFNATVTVLREGPVAMFENGVLTTGWEPVSDENFGGSIAS